MFNKLKKMLREEDIEDIWYKLGERDNWPDYILPERSIENFWNEGRLQANKIAKEFNPETDIILEYGCGIGRILKFLKAKEKHGADVSEKFLSKIEDKDIKLHKTDGLTAVYKENYFDFIYSMMVFQHNKKKHHNIILSNLYTTLKPGGKVFIQFPQELNKYYKKTTFVNLYEKKELFSLFSSVGFKDISISEGNLVGYGANGEYQPNSNLEYFVTAYK